MKCFDEMGEHQVKYRPQDIKTKTFVFYVNVYKGWDNNEIHQCYLTEDIANKYARERLGEAERIEIRRNVE